MKMQHVILLIAIILFIALLSFKFKFMHLKKLTHNFKLRGLDQYGDGSFGAPRGERKHMGIDVSGIPGQDIYAPEDLEFKRYTTPYRNDAHYTGGLYRHKEGFMKLFYMQPKTMKKYFKKGEKIGTFQNISAKYGSDMTNHIHVEMYDLDGNILNPEKFL